jgi:AsmA protein
MAAQSHALSLSGDLKLDGAKEQLSLKNAVLGWEQSDIVGSLHVKGFDAPKLKFDLRSKSLNVDTLPLGGDGPLPKETLRKLEVRGKLAVETLIIENMRFTDAKAEINAVNGLYTADPVTADAYDGSVEGKATVGFNDVTTKSRMSLVARNITLGPYFEDVAGEVVMTGKGGLSGAVYMAGDTGDDMLETLWGNGKLIAKDGVFIGIQVLPNRVAKQAARKSSKVKVEKREKQQKYDLLTATFAIKNGVLENNDLAIYSGTMKAAGEGTVDIPDEIIDYSVTVDITGLPLVPFRISGNFDEVDASLRENLFLRDAAIGILRAPVDIGVGVFEGIESGLKKLLGDD